MRRLVVFLACVAVLLAALAVAGCAGSSSTESTKTRTDISTTRSEPKPEFQATGRWTITDLCPRGGWDPEDAEAVAINEDGQVTGVCRTGKSIDGTSIVHAYLWEGDRTTDLGALGGKWSSSPSAMNERGQVVGQSIATVFGERSKAFRWDGGTMSDLGSLREKGSDNPYDQHATEINEAGQIIGVSTVRLGEEHAFLWQTGKMHDLGTLGGNDSHPNSINRDGQIVGWAGTKAGENELPRHAFLWEKGRMRDLGTLGGRDSRANDINDRGQITGAAERTSIEADSEERHAVLWQNGEIKALGTLAGRPWGEGVANNARGQIAGVAYIRFNWDTDDFVGEQAFLWENGKMTSIGTLGGEESSLSDAYDPLNDRGQVVGHSQTASGREHAFLWERGKMTDLGTLPGGKRSGALAINNHGQVVGWSESSDGNIHPVLWTSRKRG